jgi:hypothetical protein
MKMRGKITFLSLLAVLLCSGYGLAALPADSNRMPPPPPPPQHFRQDGVLQILHQLKLTDAQRQQIKAIVDSNEVKTAHDSVRVAQCNLERAVITDGNETVITEASKVLGRAIRDLALLEADILTEIETTVLTADQLTKLDKIIANLPDCSKRMPPPDANTPPPPPPHDPNTVLPPPDANRPPMPPIGQKPTPPQMPKPQSPMPRNR